jgi:hypothetical protein
MLKDNPISIVVLITGVLVLLNFPQRPFETRDELYRQMFFNEMSINLPSDSYEMIQAFYIFMQTPHALQRIINGERILDPAITKL